MLRFYPKLASQSYLEWYTIEGDSPVDEANMDFSHRVVSPGLEV